MREATLMVGHGGAGSVLLALAAGVPMVLAPMFADQSFNARRVADLGAGLAVEDVVTDLERAVRAVLDDPRFRDRSGRIADEIRGLPPIDHAVDALTALATGRTQPPEWPAGHGT